MEEKIFRELFEKIDALLKKGRVLLAIEGGSASGKSTLSRQLEERYDGTVFHMDDFFLQAHQRTRERLEEAGGNVDRERFLEEVLEPLARKETVLYRRFDCSTFTIKEPVLVEPKNLVVVEGAYSMHPDLAGFYNLSVFLQISKELQRERILKRNTADKAKRFFEEWIPLEEKYFDAMKVKEHCDMVITVPTQDLY